MAKIIWKESARQLLAQYIINAFEEYGESTAKRWQKERKDIEWLLQVCRKKPYSIKDEFRAHLV